MANRKPSKRKRQRQKKVKERIQRQLVRTQKYTEKEVKKLSYNDTLSIAEKESKRQKRKDYNEDLRRRKVAELESRGYDRSQFTKADIDRIRITDIKENRFNRENYPKWFGVSGFDFDKIYFLKDGAVVQFAFRDFAGEATLDEILAQYEGISPERLLDRLEELNNTRPTYSPYAHRHGKKKGYSGKGSSGAAGDYKFLCGDKSAAVALRQETNIENTRMRKHPKRKSHGGDKPNVGYQFIKDNGHHTYTNQITPRRLLEVTVAIMSNVTEWDRVNFYNRVYKDLVATHMPDFLRLLPYPQ